MKTVVISLGGSILIPSLEKNTIRNYVPVLGEIAAHHRLFVVVGGGGEARRYITVARNLGIDEGTSDEIGILVTRLNANLLIAALGDAAYKLVVNSTKSMTGHLLGGAGGVESVFTVLAVHHQISPPTINIFSQDPECDLDYCANAAREMKIDFALKNNFGFGGTNGSLVFKRV